MNTFAKFTIQQHEMDPAKVERLTAAYAELAAARKEIETDFTSSERYGLLTKMVQSGQKVVLGWTASNALDVGFQLNPDFAAKAASQQNQPLYLGEKTINTLLHGKLLSDAEKRKLIERVTNGAIPANAGQEPAT